MPNNKQLARIHSLKTKLGIDNDTWLDMLSQYHVTTSANLTNDQFKAFHDFLEKTALEKGVWEKRGVSRFSSDRISFLQIGKIKAMWDMVTVQTNDKDKKQALNKFVLRITGVSKLEWLPVEQVQKVIKALAVMISNKEKKACQQQSVKG